MSKDHFVTIAGKASEQHLHWWCDCGAEGYAPAHKGYENIAAQVDDHIKQIDWERGNKS